MCITMASRDEIPLPHDEIVTQSQLWLSNMFHPANPTSVRTLYQPMAQAPSRTRCVILQTYDYRTSQLSPSSVCISMLKLHQNPTCYAARTMPGFFGAIRASSARSLPQAMSTSASIAPRSLLSGLVCRLCPHRHLSHLGLY